MTRQEWIKLSAALGIGAALPHNLLAAMLTDDELKRSDFGKDFIWGTATAAYQIEGGWNEDGKGESVCTILCTTICKINARNRRRGRRFLPPVQQRY